MVRQPAYLKALKDYARAQFGSTDMIESIIADFSNESDRGAVILGATSIEDMLEYALGMRMKPLETDATARSEIFGARGSVSTFADKTLMAYALGIIDKQAKKEIDLVREIRNACAHSRLPISFKMKELQDCVKVVIGDEMLGEIKNHKPETLRIAFIIQCAMLSRYIATGKRQSPLEAFAEEVRAQQNARDG